MSRRRTDLLAPLAARYRTTSAEDAMPPAEVERLVQGLGVLPVLVVAPTLAAAREVADRLDLGPVVRLASRVESIDGCKFRRLYLVSTGWPPSNRYRECLEVARQNAAKCGAPIVEVRA